MLMSEAQTDEEDWDYWQGLIQDLSYGGDVVLDMFGDLPPRAPLQSCLGNKYEPWTKE